MLRYFNPAWRHISNEPLNAVINIFGLAIGISIFVLTLLFVHYQYSYNTFHENFNQIYRVEATLGGTTPTPYYPYFASKLPAIEGGTRISASEALLSTVKPDNKQDESGILGTLYEVDSTFLDIFTFPVLRGSEKKLFDSEDGIALTQTAANKLFGETDPLNQVVLYGEKEIPVKAILQDLPENSSMQFDAVKMLNYCQTDDDNWYWWVFETYFLIDDRKNIPELEQKLDELNFQRYKAQGGQADKLGYHIKLNPFEELYFDKDPDLHKQGNKEGVHIFSFVAIFVLLIACINYINLSLATASSRLKQLALRRIHGARKTDILYLVLAESIIIAFLAVYLAIIVIEYSLPLFRNLTGESIYLTYSPLFLIVLMLVLPVFLGVMAGIYPSVRMSRFNALDVLKGKWYSGKSGNAFRKVLTIAQFSIAIFLIISTLFVYSQLKYLLHHDPGYRMENIIHFRTNKRLLKSYQSFKEQLEKLPGVVGVTALSELVNKVEMVRTAYLNPSDYPEESKLTVSRLLVDEDFLDMFEIRLLEGKNFTCQMTQNDQQYYIINKKFADMLSAKPVLEQQINDIQIIGVVDDFYYKPLYENPGPLLITLHKNDPFYITKGCIKLKEKMNPELLQQIMDIWNQYMPYSTFQYEYVENSFKNMYKQEASLADILLFFSSVSIFIACLGLFAMVYYNTEKRTKEIGMRKSLGATERDIIVLLIRQIAVWVLVANVIAWPVAFFFLRNWLQNFSKHIDLTLPNFMIAAFISLLVALLTVIFKASRSANINPVDSLRDE